MDPCYGNDNILSFILYSILKIDRDCDFAIIFLQIFEFVVVLTSEIYYKAF